ncbi:MAG: hypothetical protein F7C33_05985, partial [Desulfurococcales archaeon]|nr:hypothetical protein [Desulfurococcales archaeon]
PSSSRHWNEASTLYLGSPVRATASHGARAFFSSSSSSMRLASVMATSTIHMVNSWNNILGV